MTVDVVPIAAALASVDIALKLSARGIVVPVFNDIFAVATGLLEPSVVAVPDAPGVAIAPAAELPAAGVTEFRGVGIVVACATALPEAPLSRALNRSSMFV